MKISDTDKANKLFFRENYRNRRPTCVSKAFLLRFIVKLNINFNGIRKREGNLVYNIF